MIGYKQFKLLHEQMGSSPLGVKGFQNLGAIGSNVKHFSKDEDDLDSDELGDDLDSDESDDDLGDDLSDLGPEKSFPPDDSEEMDGLPTPDQEMGGDIGGGDEMGPEGLGGGDEMGSSDDDALMAIAGLSGKDDAMGGEMDDMGDEMAQEPCPECNPDGVNDEGDPNCELCQGAGVVDAEGTGEEGDGAVDGLDNTGMGYDDLMAMGQEYGKAQDAKQMQAKFMNANPQQMQMQPQQQQMQGQAQGQGQPVAQGVMPNVPQQQQKVAPGFQRFMKKENAAPKAGDVGFAPTGRLGSVGSGYTKEDMKQIPMVESKFMTFDEFVAKKSK